MLHLVVSGTGASAIAVKNEDERVVRAERLPDDRSIRLDGVLDEEAWGLATPATDFLQQEPREGERSTERTLVRILYDSQNLYIGVMLNDSDPSGVLGRQLQRDAGLGADDRFMWILDTFLDGRSGYFFEINPAGLMGDGLVRGSPGGSSVNKSWDGIWDARVTRGDHGWSAEIRIPFRTLNFDANRDTWGINFQRTVRRKQEESLWSGHLRNQGLFRPIHAGQLTGLTGLSQGIGLEVKPYVVAGWEEAPGQAAEGSGRTADLGMDATYSITPSLRASVTVNTDFAEAEVDQRRVNLTRFPLVFPERRDFFLEGSGVFAFAQSSGPTPFFSRRIGLVGGQPVPIRLGARLGGSAGPYDLGFLQVRTGAHDTGPTEDFTVARVRRNILRQSTIGAIYTRRGSRAWELTDAHDAHTVGVDLDLFTSTFRGDDNLQFEAFLVWHDDPLGDDRTTFADRTARGIRLNYPNDLVQAHVSVREFGDSYAPPVGFVSRNGFRRIQPTITLGPRPNWRGVRQLEMGVHVEHLTDLRGRLETFNTTLTLFGARLESGDDGQLSVRSDFERIDTDFEIQPGIVVPAGDYTFRTWSVALTSASQRPVSVDAQIGGGGFWSGERFETQLAVDVSPRPGLSVSAEWERNDVQLPAGSFTTNLLRAGGGWQLNPWISVNGTAQYDDVSRVLGFFARFRWIVRPGSDLYLVYTQNLRDGPLSRDPRGNFSTLERRTATKLTYTHRF